jgi:hypothetical protein
MSEVAFSRAAVGEGGLFGIHRDGGRGEEQHCRENLHGERNMLVGFVPG